MRAQVLKVHEVCERHRFPKLSHFIGGEETRIPLEDGDVAAPVGVQLERRDEEVAAWIHAKRPNHCVCVCLLGCVCVGSKEKSCGDPPIDRLSSVYTNTNIEPLFLFRWLEWAVYWILSLNDPMIHRSDCRVCCVLGSVFMAAVMEYLVFETIELAGIVSKANGAPRITPEHIRTLVLNDPELGALLHRHPSLQTARVSDGSRALRDISAAVAITARTAVEGVSVITEAIACATGALFKMKVE